MGFLLNTKLQGNIHSLLAGKARHMFQLHGWKAIIRDVIFIYIFQLIYSTSLKAFLGIPSPTTSPYYGIFLIGLGFFIGVTIFCIMGIFVKEHMWRHLIWVGVILFLISFIKSAIQIYIQVQRFDPMLLTIAIAPLINYIFSILLGGGIAVIIRKRFFTC